MGGAQMSTHYKENNTYTYPLAGVHYIFGGINRNIAFLKVDRLKFDGTWISVMQKPTTNFSSCTVKPTQIVKCD